MGTRTSVLKNTVLLTAANLAMRGVAMLFQVYLTGQVGPAGMGLLQLIMTVHGLSITVGTSGLRVAAMYLSAEQYGLRRPQGVRQAMVLCLCVGAALSILVALGMILGAEALAIYWIKDLRAAESLRILGASLPLTCLGAILAGYFTAIDQVGRLVIVEICDRIATVAATVWLLQMGVTGDLSHACLSIVGGGALAGLGSTAVLMAMFLCNIHLYPSENEPHMGRRLRRLCIPVACNDYLRSGLGTLEQFLIPYGLTKCNGSRTGALASYGTIHAMVFPIMMLPSTVLFSLSDLLVPKLALCKAQNNKKRIQYLTESCLQRALLFSLLVAGFLYLMADPLAIVLYQSPEAGKYLKIFVPLLPVLYLDCIVDGMHKGLGEQVYCVRVNTFTNFLDVIGLYLLLPRWGIGGYLTTYTLTHCVNFYLSLRRLLQISGAVLSWRFLFYSIGCICFTVYICQQWLPQSASWMYILLSGGIYGSMAVLLLLPTSCIPVPFTCNKHKSLL